VSTKNKAKDFLAYFLILGLMKFYKIWRTYSWIYWWLFPESTQDTTAVAFPMQPV